MGAEKRKRRSGDEENGTQPAPANRERRPALRPGAGPAGGRGGAEKHLLPEPDAGGFFRRADGVSKLRLSRLPVCAVPAGQLFLHRCAAGKLQPLRQHPARPGDPAGDSARLQADGLQSEPVAFAEHRLLELQSALRGAGGVQAQVGAAGRLHAGGGGLQRAQAQRAGAFRLRPQAHPAAAHAARGHRPAQL